MTSLLAPSASAVKVTVSRASLTLGPDSTSGQVRLISGPEALEYSITLVDEPENGGNLLWAPRSLIVPPQTSVPLRFAYRPGSFQESGTYEYAFRIRAEKANNTTPLRDIGESNAPESESAQSGASARVALAPAIRFKVTINHVSEPD